MYMTGIGLEDETNIANIASLEGVVVTIFPSKEGEGSNQADRSPCLVVSVEMFAIGKMWNTPDCSRSKALVGL